MNRLILVMCIILGVAFSSSAVLDKDNLAYVDSLEYYLDHVGKIAGERHRHMDALKNEFLKMPRGEAKAQLGAKIGVEYVKESVDSALMYLNLAHDEALKCGKSSLANAILLKEISLYPSAGIEVEALRIFENFNPAVMSDSLRFEYWLAAAQIHHSIGSSYPEGRFKQRYMAMTLSAIDSLLPFYKSDGPVANYLSGYRYMLENEHDLATASFIGAIPELDRHPELQDFSMDVVAKHYMKIPDKRQRYISYVLQRAVKSLNRGYIRPEALENAGEILLEEGYENLAIRCLELASRYKDESYQRLSRRSGGSLYLKYMSVGKERLSVIYNIVWIFLALLAVFLFFMVLRYRKLFIECRKTVENKDERIKVMLEEVVKVNTNLVGLAFLSLEQLRDFSIHVFRKLQGGQGKDLYDEVSSGSYQSKMQEKFFEVFDSGFLSTFPDFVENLNKLLIPGKELCLLPGGRMSPELRIAAFLRLGVSDSTKLSQALNLSLNTIYTYRNRLRGRARDRENFEADLVKCV